MPLKLYRSNFVWPKLFSEKIKPNLSSDFCDNLFPHIFKIWISTNDMRLGHWPSWMYALKSMLRLYKLHRFNVFICKTFAKSLDYNIYCSLKKAPIVLPQIVCLRKMYECPPLQTQVCSMQMNLNIIHLLHGKSVLLERAKHKNSKCVNTLRQSNVR